MEIGVVFCLFLLCCFFPLLSKAEGFKFDSKPLITSMANYFWSHLLITIKVEQNRIFQMSHQFSSGSKHLKTNWFCFKICIDLCLDNMIPEPKAIRFILQTQAKTRTGGKAYACVCLMYMRFMFLFYFKKTKAHSVNKMWLEDIFLRLQQPKNRNTAKETDWVTRQALNWKWFAVRALPVRRARKWAFPIAKSNFW